MPQQVARLSILLAILLSNSLVACFLLQKSQRVAASYILGDSKLKKRRIQFSTNVKDSSSTSSLMDGIKVGEGREIDVSSLEGFTLGILRFLLKITPLRVLSAFCYVMRILLKYTVSSEKKLKISQFGSRPGIDEISVWDPSMSRSNLLDQPDAIIYIHGGGFALCDCTDLMIAERLLPLLVASDCFQAPPVIYSILYTTLTSQPSHERILSEVQRAYDDIITSGKRVLCIIGDSAGGNLAISLALRHQNNEQQNQLTKVAHGLCLISPWVEMFSNSMDIHNDKFDMLDTSFLTRCRDQYLGKVLTKLGIRYSKELVADELTTLLEKQGIKVVVFDMDQCIVAMHSMGTLKRGKNLNKYLNKISEDFVLLSNVLHQRGIKLAVATHSDSMEYNRRGPLNISRSTHIMGEDLVEMVLERSVPALLPYFKVIAYNPRVRGDKDVNNAHKKLHLRQIATYYNVSQNECLLFDDDKGNVMDTDERFYGIRVDEKHAFRLSPELFQTIASKINRDVKTASIGESLTSLTHLSNSLIYDVDNFREYWKDNNIINIEYLCPNTASDTQLSNLPPTLITVGESEIMVDDIELFSNRLIKLHNNRHSSSSSTSSSTFMEIASYLVKGEGDVHVYPTLWRHPFHRVMSPLGLQWLFNLVFPQRALISKELKAVYKKGRDGFELIDSNTEIHSKTADDAIVEIAKFIIKIKKSLDINT